MKNFLTCLSFLVLLYAAPAHASVPVDQLKECILNNDAPGCRALLTPASYSVFDRFAAHKLLVCVPSNWTVESQKQQGATTIVTASIPASNRARYITRLVYQGDKLDLPSTLRLGMGERWENKINLAEQLYMMMKQNMGSKLTCDTIAGIIEPKGKK